MSARDMLMVVMNQTIRPEKIEQMDKLLSLLDKLLTTVKLYKLECNMEREAAEISYGFMSKE